MLLASLTAESLKTLFPSHFYLRGNDYFLQGKVYDLSISHHKGKGDIIRASVTGSQSYPYDIRINISGPANKLYIYGVCSCPMRINCKHVIATLLTALNKISTVAPISTDNSSPYNIRNQNLKFPTQITPSQITPTQTTAQHNRLFTTAYDKTYDTRVDYWIKEVNDTLLSERPRSLKIVDETCCLCYSIFIPPYKAIGQLSLNLEFARRLKKGGLGKPQSFRQTYSTQKYLYPIDKELLVKLEMYPLHKVG